MKQQFHLDIFERYYKRGLDARRRGELALARTSFLKAAENLYKLAALSEGPLQASRKAKAAKLVALARSIRPQTAPTAGEAPPSAAAAGGGDKDGEDDKKWVVTDAPNVSMDDVAGLDDVKATVRKRVIYPFEHPETTRRFRKRAGGGVLLYGPPGTGKTMIAKAITNEVDATFFAVKCSDIMSKWVGQAEQNLKQLFDAARARPRAVVFLDETEAIVSKRGGDSTVMNRLIPEFLAQVDGLGSKHEGVLLLGATNRPWDMDDAALRPGRFGELIYVPLPDEDARRKILADALTGIPMSEEIDLAELVVRTDGYSGADLVALCERAKDEPYEREIDTGTPQRLEPDDLDKALKAQRPSVSPNMLAKYRKYQDLRSAV